MNGRLLGVRRPGAALAQLRPRSARGQSGARPPHSEEDDNMNTWSFDPAYTTVEFVIRNLWFKVKGRFLDLEGTIVLDEDDISRSSVTATIKVDSIETGNQRRDAHLRARDFFDVERFPDIEFKSTSV